MASTIGAKVYIDKLYNSIGGNTAEQELQANINKQTHLFLEEETKSFWDNLCTSRFPSNIYDELANNAQIAKEDYRGVISSFDINKATIINPFTSPLTDELIEKLNKTPHYMLCDENTTEQRHGLGLLIVKQIVSAHNGTTTIEHSSYGGFSVKFTLPIQK